MKSQIIELLKEVQAFKPHKGQKDTLYENILDFMFLSNGDPEEESKESEDINQDLQGAYIQSQFFDSLKNEEHGNFQISQERQVKILSYRIYNLFKKSENSPEQNNDYKN